MDTIPLSYANFLILLVLRQRSHGYEIMKKIAAETNNVVTIGPATMYRALSFFLDNNYIVLLSEDEHKKQYQLTTRGQELLQKQITFINLLHEAANKKGLA